MSESTCVRKYGRGAICAVYGCNNYKSQKDAKSFFRMPKDVERLKKWIIFCKRKDLDDLFKVKDSNYFYNSYVVCSDHFEVGCFRKFVVEPGHAVNTNRIPSKIQQGIPFGVPDYKALLYASILEVALMELHELDKLNTHIRIQNLMIDFNYLKTVKYKLALRNEEDKLNTIDPDNLGCSNYKLIKLLTDRELITKVIQDTYISLKTNRTFTALGNYVLERIKHAKYRKQLEEDEKHNTALRHELHKRLRLQRRHNKKELITAKTYICNLRVQLEDQELMEAVGSRYVDGWQRARTFQHQRLIADEEGVCVGNIINYKLQRDDEHFVHQSIHYYLTVTIEETLKQIAEWMDKFDTDLEDIDLRVRIKNHELHEVKIKRTALEEKFAAHEEQINSWKKFIIEKENVRIYREKMFNAAVAVQAWWRGLLVRKHLGPYQVRRVKKRKLNKYKF